MNSTTIRSLPTFLAILWVCLPQIQGCSKKRCETADALAHEAFDALKIYKTHDGAISSGEANEYLPVAARAAREAHNSCETDVTLAMTALMNVYEARLTWGNETNSTCEEKLSTLAALDSVTYTAAYDGIPTAQGSTARALWAFKDCQCAAIGGRGITATCNEATEQFEQAFDLIDPSWGQDWFRFEIGWQWQMHLFILGNLRREDGDLARARATHEEGMATCYKVEEFAGDAPINDAELYKNCGRNAAALEQWDELSYFSFALASVDPAVGDRSSVGPVPALARAAVLRDPACSGIPAYTDTRYSDRAHQFKGYPKARRGDHEHHFCIGWAYAQLGCNTAARREFGTYLRYGGIEHKEEARDLRDEIRAGPDTCVVPGI